MPVVAKRHHVKEPIAVPTAAPMIRNKFDIYFHPYPQRQQKKYLGLEEKQQNKIQSSPIAELEKFHTYVLMINGLEFD